MNLDAMIDAAQQAGTKDGTGIWESIDSRDAARHILETVSNAVTLGTIAVVYDETLATQVAPGTYDLDFDSADWSTVVDAYKMALVDAILASYEREAMYVLGIDPTTGKPYHADLIGGVVEWPRGVASEIVGGANGDNALVLVMVGDDREHIVTMCTLTLDALDATNGDYCPGCGQVGCHAYGIDTETED